MTAVPLHHQTLRAGKAKLCQQGIQIGGAVVAVSGDQQFAAPAQVAAQVAHLVHQCPGGSKILHGVVDDEQVTVFRDAVREHIQPGESQVLVFQCTGQGIRQRLLPVVGGVVGVMFFPAGQAVDGRGDLVFPVKGHAGSTCEGIVAVVFFVEVRGIQHRAVFAADQNEASIGHICGPILGGKGRVEGRVFPLPAQVAALRRVVIQQLGDDDILVARLRQIINFNVLGQIFDHLNGVVAQGVEPRLREVPFRIPGRDGPDDEVEQNDQHQHQRRDRCGIDSAAEDFTGCFAFLPLVPIQFHTVFLLSVPAALLDALRRKEQEQPRHREVIHQRRERKTVVDEFFKGGKQAQRAQHRAERAGQPGAL